MKNRLLNLLFLTLLFTIQGVYAVENLSAKRFDPQAKQKADNLYNQAQRYYLKKEYAKAAPLYEASYQFKPSKDIPANIGISYKHIGDYAKAKKWYEIGVKKYNDSKSAFNLGLLYEKIKKYNKAIEWYNKAFTMGETDGGG